MTRLFIIPGHGAGDPGACGFGYSEAERVRALASKIKELGGDAVTLADFSRNYYADNGLSYLTLPDDYCVIELHMDSGAVGAHGGHVITAPGCVDDYDRAIANLMADMFPGRANLIVERSDLANPWRAYNSGLNYRLVENGFISNWNDLQTFNNCIEELAKGYLEAFDIERKDTMAMAPVTVPAEGTPVWRMYYENWEHMYTASEVERDIMMEAGWQNEGVAWISPEPQVAIYRLYNPKLNQHLLTADFDEAVVVEKAGWAYEGVQLFAAKNGEPVFRAYNPNSSEHFLTTSKEEIDSLVKLGWRDEGVAFHV